MNVHAKADKLEDLLLVKQLIDSCELVKFVSSCPAQFRVPPHLRKFPVTPCGYSGNFQHFRDLVVVQPTKIFQLDYLSLSGVECRELFQGLVQIDNLL